MSYRMALSLLGVVVLSSICTRNASASSDLSESSAANTTIVLRTSDLRSAYLIRSGVTSYDADDLSPTSLRRQLQRHFDTVAALLFLATPQSIEIALDRLEASQHASWTGHQREMWRRRLLADRGLQIARLLEYRNRGRFPLNEGHAAHPVPIFVDVHDTACAVGHLMRLSGRENEVAAIERDDNFVYVPDVATGPVVAWVLTSGITLEEAALIQPAYGPVLIPKPDHAIEVLNDEMSFVFGALRYSSFKLFPVEENSMVPAVNIPVTHHFCSWYEACTALWSEIVTPDGELVPTVSHDYPRIVVQFDVEVTSPNLRIANIPVAGTLLSGSYFNGNQLRLFVNSSRDQLWIDHVNNKLPEFEFPIWGQVMPILPIRLIPSGEFPSTNREFQPTDRMTVATEMLFPPGQTHRGQFIIFPLLAVPEAGTATTLVVLAVGMFAWVRPCRRQR